MSRLILKHEQKVFQQDGVECQLPAGFTQLPAGIRCYSGCIDT